MGKADVASRTVPRKNGRDEQSQDQVGNKKINEHVCVDMNATKSGKCKLQRLGTMNIMTPNVTEKTNSRKRKSVSATEDLQERVHAEKNSKQHVITTPNSTKSGCSNAEAKKIILSSVRSVQFI